MDKTAQEVLDLINKGQYITDRVIPFAEEQKRAVEGTVTYTPKQGLFTLENEKTGFVGDGIRITVTDETTQVAAHRIIKLEHEKNVALLNFASARHPGGGFLRGSRAQEEDLCRCSGLFPCLEPQAEYYKYNQSRKTPLYSDYTIYSPKVPWFRKVSSEQPNDLFLASVITSPAPNVSQLNRYELREEIKATLKQRAGIILAIAQDNGHRNLILGAWGCGVFSNDPAMVADIFGEWLESPRFAYAFDHVTFAVYCPSSDKSILKAFQERFKKSEQV